MSAAILRMQDELARRGCKVMTADDHMVHVSGHPARDELKRLYQLVKPKYAVPVHGEWRHLSEHAALAKDLQRHPGAGRGWRRPALCPGTAGRGRGRADRAPRGRRRPAAADHGGVLAARKRMLFNGVVIASFAVDEAGRVLGHAAGLGARAVRWRGPIPARSSPPTSARAVGDLPSALRREDDALREAARSVLRKAIGRRLRKRPNVEVHLLRV